MAAPADPLNVGTYNVEKALYYLGPQNYGAGEPDSCCGHIGILIQNLVTTILRIINFIFGDHQWYNNETAIDIVAQYYRGPAGTPELANKIDELYQSLRTRGDGCCYADTSYADRIDIAAARLAQQGNQNVGLQIIGEPVRANVPVTAIRVQNFDISTPVIPGAIHETGNISIRPFVQKKRNEGNLSPEQVQRKTHLEHKDYLSPNELKELQKLTDLSSLQKIPDEEIGFYAESIEKAQREYQLNYGVEGEQAKLMYREEVKAVAPRKGPEGVPNERDIQTPLLEAFKDAKDPYDLIKEALILAFGELRISPQMLKQSTFSVSQNYSKALRLAVFLIIQNSQLKIDSDDCHGVYITPNNIIKTRYQKPQLVFTRDPEDHNGDYISKAVFDVDLFSSTYVGCDPDGAKRLMQNFTDAQIIDSFKANFVNGTAFPQEAIEKQLEEVLATMVDQVRNRYGMKALEMATKKMSGEVDTAPVSFSNLTIPANSTFEIAVPFEDYVNHALTPYQLIYRSLTWSAQKIASNGLINEDDLEFMGDFLQIKTLSCRLAVLNLIKRAQVESEFSIKFSSRVQIELGRYFAHEPTVENPSILKATEYYVPTEFGGKGVADDRASDPIRAKVAYSRLTESDKVLFEEFYTAAALYSLYTAKQIPKEQLRDIEIVITKFNLSSLTTAEKEAVKRANQNLQQVPEDKLQLFRKIGAELDIISSRFWENYFDAMFGSFKDHLNIPANARPTVVPIHRPVLSEATRMNQPIQAQFLPQWCRANVKIDSRPIVNRRPTYDVNNYQQFTAYNRNLADYQYAAIMHQNSEKDNPARCGNCMYGALALEIFGNSASQQIENYAGALRSAVADYMLANQEAFLPAMLNETTDLKARHETNEAFDRRYRNEILPALPNRLRDYCNSVRDNNNLLWGGGLEMEAVAAIFGVQIHIFKVTAPLKIVDKTIQPNTIIGNMYGGKAPIRLVYVNNNHFKPIHLR